MATLEIDLDATLIVSMVRALNTFCMERPDLLSEIIYEHGETFAEVAGSVDALRALESAAADRDLTDAEDAALHKARSNGGTWMRRKAGQILTVLESPLRDDRAACDASSVDAANPIRDNIAGTRVRYLGKVESIEGKTGVLTGTKRTPGELGVECVGVMIDETEWLIPCEFPQFEMVAK